MKLDITKTITQLRAFTTKDVHLNPTVNLSDTGKDGVFKYDSSDTTTADNTGTVVVTASGARYKRLAQEEILSSWFDNTNTGFQNFINTSVGRIGIINNSFSLSTTINMDTGQISMRNGITVTTSAAVGFLWTRKKGFIADNWNFTSSNTTSGNCLLKIDGLWNATFNNCTFNGISANVDIIQMLPGDNGTDKWGTYFCVFNNMKTGGGRYVCKADGAATGPSYLTHAFFNECWATGGVSYIKATKSTAFGIVNLCADSLSGHAIDLTTCSDFTIFTKEVTPGGGFYTLNETTDCNKNIVNFGSRVTDFTSNLDTLGILPNEITLQGSNVNADNFKTRLKNVFSYAGTLLLQGKGGTNTWVDLIKWSETIGTELKAGYNNYLRIKEPRVSIGASDQMKTYVKTMSATSSQNQDIIYFSLTAVSQAMTAEVTIHYRSNDNTVAVIQKVYVTACVSSGGTLLHTVILGDRVISGTTVLPLISSYYSGSGTTFSMTHSNIALAATMDIEIKWSSTASVNVS